MDEQNSRAPAAAGAARDCAAGWNSWSSRSWKPSSRCSCLPTGRRWWRWIEDLLKFAQTAEAALRAAGHDLYRAGDATGTAL